LHLPDPAALSGLPPTDGDGKWSDPPEFDAPLVTESVAATLFAAIERELHRELPASWLVSAWLEDGASESALLSTAGLDASWRARAAYLRLEVEDRGCRCRFEGAESEARQFDPRSLALRLVDRLCALGPGRQPAAPDEAGAGASETTGTSPVRADLPLLLAAPLAARLVQAMSPLFLGLAAHDRIAALGEFSPLLTLVDDGRLLSGVLASPVDGEGMPCGRVALVEGGRFVRPLLAWWEAPGSSLPGCARRASWRDLPRRAPTHLFAAAGTTPVADLVASGEAGAYLLDAEGGVRIDSVSLAFEVAVSGLLLVDGRAVAPLGRVRLCGDVKTLLGGIRALARDLQFVPGDGMFGAPSMLVSGLRVLPA
jgi:predicted Zn-dependent protease